jgi:hypothetical protein
MTAGCTGQIGETGSAGSTGNPTGSSTGTGGTGTINVSTGGTTGGGAGGTVSSGGGTAGGGAGSAGSAGSSGTVADTGLPCDVQTLLSNTCWACHGTTPLQAGMPSLVTRANLMAPSAASSSQTYAQRAVARMQSTTLPMPPAPATPATAAQVATLSNWIAAGYPTGSCGTTTTGTGGVGGSGTGGAGGSGVPDPFTVAPTCTSGVTWNGGNNGSQSMNPGMACISCHTSTGGEAPRYSIAGTVYPTAHEPNLCNGANGTTTGAQIVIVGADGKTLTLTPNSAGNFFSPTTVALPYQAKVTYQGRERVMLEAQTSGDCNSCHTQSGANNAPGRILLP